MSEEASSTDASEQVIKGRSVFLVETTPAGIAVQTALLTEEGKLLNSPAIFPDVEYAFAQVDDLKRLISAHFSQAARLGAQVAAQQAQANGAPTELPAEGAQVNAGAPVMSDASEGSDADSPLATGRKALDNIKKFVYSGLAQVSKIAQPSSTATPAPENTPHIETTAGNGVRKTRSVGKKPKNSSISGDV